MQSTSLLQVFLSDCIHYWGFLDKSWREGCYNFRVNMVCGRCSKSLGGEVAKSLKMAAHIIGLFDVCSATSL